MPHQRPSGQVRTCYGFRRWLAGPGSGGPLTAWTLVGVVRVSGLRAAVLGGEPGAHLPPAARLSASNPRPSSRAGKSAHSGDPPPGASRAPRPVRGAGESRGAGHDRPCARVALPEVARGYRRRRCAPRWPGAWVRRPRASPGQPAKRAARALLAGDASCCSAGESWSRCRAENPTDRGWLSSPALSSQIPVWIVGSVAIPGATPGSAGPGPCWSGFSRRRKWRYGRRRP